MRIRPSTLAIVVVVALLFAGLYITDRELRQAEDAQLRADAHDAASVASTFLLVQAEALSALNGIFVDGVARPSAARFDAILRTVGDNLSHFQVVGVADSGGIVLHFDVVNDSLRGRRGDDRIDVDTLALADLGRLARVARARRATAVAAPVNLVGTDSAILLLDPVTDGESFRGFVGGAVELSHLRSAILGREGRPADEGVVLLNAQGDTVLSIGERAVGADTAWADVALPGAARWRLRIHRGTQSPVRLRLIGVALAALGALVLGGWHERRQSRRIAERSRELERLSEELLDANRAKSEFLANVSHELRTPLNAIVGFTELLRDGVYGELSPRQAGPVRRIEASAGHLRVLVDQVLDLAKMTAGRLEVHAEAVDLRQVVLDVGTEMEPLFAERGLTFNISVGAGVPRMRTDPAHVRQVLVNLLGNAVKFTETGGITVRTRLVSPAGSPEKAQTPSLVASVPGTRMSGATAVEAAALRSAAPDPSLTWVAVQVTDTGIGIAPRDHERIFDEFEQVNAGSRGDSERRGTGLGLPISRRLARLLGGELTVDSQLGRGSTFTLWLPVA